MSKLSSREMNVKRVEILDFATENNFVINPSKGMEQYVQNIFEFGHCPCDSNRPNCPCDLAAEEIEKQGYCRCRLYYRDLPTFRGTFPLPGDPKDELTGNEEIDEFMKRCQEDG